MGKLDTITVILFSLAVLVTGISLARAGRDLKGFFGGGGNIPWPMAGLSLFMGFFSAGTFVVWGSIAYSCGLTAIIIQLTMAVAGFTVGTFIAPRWHRTGALTAAEYITDNFGQKTQKVYTGLFLAVSVFTSGSFLYPVAKILEVAAGVPLTASILGLGLFCIIYTALGGLRGVMVTDVLQFVILFTAVIVAVPLSFDRIGGVQAFFDKAPQGFFECFSGEYTPWFIFAFCLYNAVFLGGNWSYVQRYTSVRTEKDSRKVGWLFGALYLVSPVLWMLPPMIYRIYNPGLSGLDNENAYLLMCREALPDGLLGLMLGGMIFATASSLNGTLNISAGVFTNDIYRRIRPGASDRELIRAARISTAGFGVLAIIVAMAVKSMGGIVNVVISIAALTGVPLYLPVIWSMFSKRQTGRTLLSATFISLIVNLLLKFCMPALWGVSLSRGQEMMVGTLVPVFILTVFEICLAAKNYERPGTGKVDEPAEFTGKVEQTGQSEQTGLAEQAGQSEHAGQAQQAEQTKQVGQTQLTSGESSGNDDNRFTCKVLGISISVAGIAVAALGAFSGSRWYITVCAGVAVIAIGLLIFRKSLK